MDEKIKDALAPAAKALENVTDLFHKLAGPLAEELGLMFGDKAREYRVRNWISVEKQVRQMLAEANAEPHSIPPRQFLPLLEGASLEDEPTLQERWAALIANFATSDFDMPAVFIEFLKELSPIEAIALNRMWEAVVETAQIDAPAFTCASVSLLLRDVLVISEDDMKPFFDDLIASKGQHLGFAPDSLVDVAVPREISIANLVRLGILERFNVGDNLQYMPTNRFEMRYRFTPLGWYFVHSCQALQKTAHCKIYMR
jgi:hypothetical protein